MVSDVSRIIDSPIVKWGCAPASNARTDNPCRAKTAASVEPPMPVPIIATSYFWFGFFIILGFSCMTIFKDTNFYAARADILGFQNNPLNESRGAPQSLPRRAHQTAPRGYDGELASSPVEARKGDRGAGIRQGPLDEPHARKSKRAPPDVRAVRSPWKDRRGKGRH